MLAKILEQIIEEHPEATIKFFDPCILRASFLEESFKSVYWDSLSKYELNSLSNKILGIFEVIYKNEIKCVKETKKELKQLLEGLSEKARFFNKVEDYFSKKQSKRSKNKNGKKKVICGATEEKKRIYNNLLESFNYYLKKINEFKPYFDEEKEKNAYTELESFLIYISEKFKLKEKPYEKSFQIKEIKGVFKEDLKTDEKNIAVVAYLAMNKDETPLMATEDFDLFNILYATRYLFNKFYEKMPEGEKKDKLGRAKDSLEKIILYKGKKNEENGCMRFAYERNQNTEAGETEEANEESRYFKEFLNVKKKIDAEISDYLISDDLTEGLELQKKELDEKELIKNIEYSKMKKKSIECQITSYTNHRITQNKKCSEDDYFIVCWKEQMNCENEKINGYIESLEKIKKNEVGQKTEKEVAEISETEKNITERIYKILEYL